MKKFLVTCSLLLLGFLPLNIEAVKTPKTLYKIAKETKKKLPEANWPYQFNAAEGIFDINHVEIDPNDKVETKVRYERMLHFLFFNYKNSDAYLDRIESVSNYLPDCIDYIEKKLREIYLENTHVLHISIYGSFLYNIIDPDDVDMQIIVESPVPIFEHIEASFTEITGQPNVAHLPVFSFQIIDYMTYKNAKKKSHANFLTRGEKIALQHSAMAASWYFTVYGLDLRFDPPSELKVNTKSNYLYRAFNTLNAAGSRLYKSAYAIIPPESDRVRLRKVVSRILITDFMIPAIDPAAVKKPQIYENFYKEIRNLKDSDKKKIRHLEDRIRKLYFQKLDHLLRLSDKQGKIENIELVDH